MLIKLLGFIIIIISSAKIGFDFSSNYTARTSELKALAFLLEKLKSEIGFSNNVVLEVLEKNKDIKNTAIKDLFADICVSVKKENLSLYMAFEKYLQEKNKLSLTKDDLQVVGDFLTMLGTSDVDDEIKNINSTIGKLNLLLQDSCEKESKYVKLCRTSGVLAGCLISVILA